jgi:hypothetical protein
MRQKRNKKVMCNTFPACVRVQYIYIVAYMAPGYELSPNRDISGPGRTQHVPMSILVCAPTKTASPLTFVLQPPCTLTGCDTAGAGRPNVPSLWSVLTRHRPGIMLQYTHDP